MANEESSYDLKESTSLVGQLYPLLKAKDGELLDGVHRSDVDATWKTEVLENIDTPEKKLAARLIANIHRRTVPKEEKAAWINDLAELYLKQGLKVEARYKGKPGQGANQITNKIVKVTGLSKRVVTGYLKDCYKQMNFSRGIKQRKAPEAPAGETILNILNSHSKFGNNGYGTRLMERYKEELLKSPLFRAEVLNSLPKGKGFKRMVDVNVLGLSGDQNGDPVGIKKRNSHGFPKLPKGEGMPKKEVLDENYYEIFKAECPGCLCSQCPHAMECIERVRPDEEPIRPKNSTKSLNAQSPKVIAA